MPYSTGLKTPLSNFEAGENYQVCGPCLLFKRKTFSGGIFFSSVCCMIVNDVLAYFLFQEENIFFFLQQMS